MNMYERLSAERKALQAANEMPAFWSTGSWQMFKAKYLYQAKTPKEQYQRIARTAAKHINVYPDWWEGHFGKGYTWEDAFFNVLWQGDLSASTPVLANMGTNRGLPVSCSGNYIEDSIDGFYSAKREIAILTKYGFGTASYLGKIRPRGAPISTGGVANGPLPVITGIVKDMEDVSQGNTRRGAWAGYIEIDHPDFWEIVHHLENQPDDLNIGWIITEDFKNKLDSFDDEAIRRYQAAMKTKAIVGKGYKFFPYKAEKLRPQMYKDLGLDVVAPQLCNEIMLHSSPEYTYTCVLSSMNALRFDEWVNTKAVFVATVFLDCVVSEFIEQASKIPGLEKAVAFTLKGRALGLGVCGFHSYLQKNLMEFGSFEAHQFNNELFGHLHDESLEASKWLAEALGEPEWCRGYGVRNTHRTAVAPTKSTALIMGGVSEGISPDPAMTFTQMTAAGEVDRINPILLEMLKSAGLATPENIQEIIDAQGSVQGVSWLDAKMKGVFKTAFEINQLDIIRLAAARQRKLCQGQSLNLFFAGDESEEFISYVHQVAYDNPFILGLYYFYSKAGVTASKGECTACQ